MFMFITILDTPMGMEISTRTGYEAYISELHKSNDDGTSRDPSTGGRLNMGLLRYLCVTAFSPYYPCTSLGLA
ncbi:hypothetical protein PENSUB_4157 [Penicillium subrubescens]|uniref:Uncharacterized protein n=1 Tax=Penicillium subrubescens TaxID=1316194 RepID=A0A1Q5UD90_9EURO|nr:hypothetical protein PENSUB_4157 [Penicillium subrubescens]